MKACARAAGADRTATTATKAANGFEKIDISVPWFGGEIGRANARGQPVTGQKQGCRTQALKPAAARDVRPVGRLLKRHVQAFRNVGAEAGGNGDAAANFLRRRVG